MHRWIWILAACGGNHAASPDAPVATDDGMPDSATMCPRTAPSADRVRHVVISHPYDHATNKSNQWEVLDLSPTGTLSRPNRMFTMGRATIGDVAFTPDGKVGLAVQDEDGSLGVLTLDDGGVRTAITPKLAPASFYASKVVMAPSGDHAYILDDQWRENGGGIYRVDIACDGTVTDKGLVAPAKLAGALAFVPGTSHAVLAAVDIGTSTPGASTHLLDWAEPPTWLGGSNAFGDDLAIVAGSALTADAKHFLIGDNNQYSGLPNRVAIVEVTASGMANPTVISNLMDPLELVASPYGDVVLVVCGLANAFYVIDNEATGWKLRGEVTYMGTRPQLPSGAVRIDAGMLRGNALVAELQGVRRVELAAGGTVIDHGLFDLGGATENVAGAIGVTP